MISDFKETHKTPKLTLGWNKQQTNKPAIDAII